MDETSGLNEGNEKYSVCAYINHDEDAGALHIYHDHDRFENHYTPDGWLVFFTKDEEEFLSNLVSIQLQKKNIELPWFDIDGLSKFAISIYTATNTTLLRKMMEASGVKVNQADQI